MWKLRSIGQIWQYLVSCLELRNRGGIREERKGAMVQTTEGEVVITRCMKIPNLSLTRIMVSQEVDIVVAITTKEILHTILTKGMVTTHQTTVNSNIAFNKDIRHLGATVDREGTQVGVAISEVEEDKEDQMVSTHLTVLASLITVIGVKGVWIVSMELDTGSGTAPPHSNVLFAMVHTMLGSVRSSRRRNTPICYIIVDTTILRELAWQNLT